VADLGEGALGAIAPNLKKIFGFYQQKRLKNKLIQRCIIMIAPRPLQWIAPHNKNPRSATGIQYQSRLKSLLAEMKS
jgi:hypothetical protein